jgi:hypothetical protein
MQYESETCVPLQITVDFPIFLHSKAAAISFAFPPALLLQGCVPGVLKFIVNLIDLAMKFRLKNNKLLIYCNQKLKLI